MIELPAFATRGFAVPSLIDTGFTQRGISTSTRISRKGSRYRVSCSYGPFSPDEGRVMVQRLISAKQEGLRIAFPLLHAQPLTGTPLLKGAVTTGTSITIDGMTTGQVVSEGFFLSLVKDGQHYLHSVKTGGTVNGSGEVTITLGEMLRTDVPNNAVVHFAQPMVEGLVEGDEWGWQLSVDRVLPIEFSIEEAA